MCDYPYDRVRCKHDEWGAVLEFDKFESKYNEWFDAMEIVMKKLDENGIFGTGDDRKRVFVYSEESPPDEEFESRDCERAERMNPQAIYKEWLNDQTW